MPTAAARAIVVRARRMSPPPALRKARASRVIRVRARLGSAGRAVPCAAMLDALQRPRAAVPEGRGRPRVGGFALALAGIVVLGLVLRLWGIRWGLPFAYNLADRPPFGPRPGGFFPTGPLDPA